MTAIELDFQALNCSQQALVNAKDDIELSTARIIHYAVKNNAPEVLLQLAGSVQHADIRALVVSLYNVLGNSNTESD